MYGNNHTMSPTTKMLLHRLRRVLDNQGDDGCQVTDDELVARGLALQLEALGVSGHTNAAMLSGGEPEPA